MEDGNLCRVLKAFPELQRLQTVSAKARAAYDLAQTQLVEAFACQLLVSLPDPSHADERKVLIDHKVPQDARMSR